MKRIILVRHAKTIQQGYDNDFNRTLKPIGIDDAHRISRKLKGMIPVPDIIRCSPAVRTLHTATIYAEVLGFSKAAIQQQQSLYEGYSSGELIDQLQKLDDSVNSIMIVGHNPTIHSFASTLINYFNADYPTCTTTGICFNIDTWKKLEARQGELEFYLTPSHLKG